MWREECTSIYKWMHSPYFSCNILVVVESNAISEREKPVFQEIVIWPEMHSSLKLLIALSVVAISSIALTNCAPLLFLGENNRIIGNKDLDSLRPLLLTSLEDLKRQEAGPILHLVRIVSAKSQTLAGKLHKYVINAEFATEFKRIICKVTVWHRTWKSFRESTFDCDDKTKYEVKKPFDYYQEFGAQEL